MKTDKEKELDDLFKKGLGEPPHEAAYREGDWNALEQKLDNSGKRGGGLLFWLPILSSAAVLLLLIGWWIFKPVTTPRQQKPQQAMVIKSQPKPVAAQQTAPEKQQVASITHEQNNLDKGATSVESKATVKYRKHANYAESSKTVAHKTGPDLNRDSQSANHINMIADRKKDLGDGDEKKDLGNGDAKYDVRSITTISDSSSRRMLAETTNSRPDTSFSSPVIGYVPNKRTIDSIKSANEQRVAVVEKHKAVKPGFLNRPQYTLSFIGAPERNSVGSLQDGRSGTNLGMLFSVGLKKLTFSTGAMYAIKPYSASFSSGSYQSSIKGYSNVNADCRVLDIPINVDYQLYSKHQNKFSIGSGFSSYIMLHESYVYNFNNPATSPVNYTVPNSNKYFFSILNLQATYTRQVSSKVGISLQPYLKLPLSGIGASEAKLQTTGVAIGLNWNLNSISKL